MAGAALTTGQFTRLPSSSPPEATARSGTSPTIALRPERVPLELRAMRGWVVSSPDKVPLNPSNLRPANPTVPSSGGDFDGAVAAASRPGLGRIGLILNPATRLVAVDFDGCRDPVTGAIDPAVQAEIDRLDSYTEVSPSGTGIRVLAYGALPPGRRKNGKREVYDRDRYVSVTGHVLQERRQINERAEQIVCWHRETFGAPVAAARAPRPDTIARDDDDAILARALAARNGDKVRRLWAGDTGEHGGDHSDADLALVSCLCFWTADDDQVDRLFRRSGLYREEKWGRRADYRERTIAKARATQPGPPPPTTTVGRPTPQVAVLPDEPTDAGGDPCADVLDEVASLRAEVAALTPQLAERDGQLDERDEQLAATRRRAEAAERRASLVTEAQSRTAGIMANAGLRSARPTAVALAHLFANREAAGDPGADGLYPVNVRAFARDNAGCSDDAAAKHLDLLGAEGLIRSKTEWVAGAWTDGNGVVHPGRKQRFVGPVGGALAFIDAARTVVPTRCKRDGTADQGWGGARGCPDHPGGAVVVASEASCGVCGKRLGKLKIETFASLAESATALGVAAGPTPQLAGLGGRSAALPPSVDDVSISRDARTWSNRTGRNGGIAGRELASGAAERAAVAKADLLRRTERDVSGPPNATQTARCVAPTAGRP